MQGHDHRVILSHMDNDALLDQLSTNSRTDDFQMENTWCCILRPNIKDIVSNMQCMKHIHEAKLLA